MKVFGPQYFRKALEIFLNHDFLNIYYEIFHRAYASVISVSRFVIFILRIISPNHFCSYM